MVGELNKDEIAALSNDELVKYLAREKRRLYQSNYRKTHPQKQYAESKKYSAPKRRRLKMLDRPFIGCDGEGAGKGRKHIYWLLRVGDQTLYHEDGSELQSMEILTWLANLGKSGICDKYIPIAFYFDYDTTMILRHLPERCLRELTSPTDICLRSNCKHSQNKHLGRGACLTEGCECRQYIYSGSTIVWPYPDNKERYIKISLRHRQLKVAWNDGAFITITDVADIFQMSFVKTLELWKNNDDGSAFITNEEIESIKSNKERRAEFEIGFDKDTFTYNELECELLCRIMTVFRQNCADNNLLPDNWTGPGRLAEKVFTNINLPKKADLDLPPIIEMLAEYAYYGGRFEGTWFGQHQGPIYAFDIASAYPHAYTKLPCLVKGHGSWSEIQYQDAIKGDLQNTLIIGALEVIDPLKQRPVICGLPMRDKQGGITFPTTAHGAYWYPEFKAAINFYEAEGITFNVNVSKCFTWTQTCDDQPGSFIQPLFDYRKSLGKSARGYPIKLMLNSLYGKAAQKVGRPQWANGVWAGLITAITRARLLDATIILGAENIISYQTDGLVSKVSGLETGIQLGDWEETVYNDFFLIQSGVYIYSDDSGDEHSKTRGITEKEFNDNKDDLIKAWEENRWDGEHRLIPDRNAFITIQLGLQWNHIELIGTWIDQPRTISYKANEEKRETFDFDTHVRSVDGRTYAPSGPHELLYKRKYGPHPLNPSWKGAKFTYPYTRQLVSELNKLSVERKLAEFSYSSPDEPYITAIGEN